ncbi:NUDIX domain-containing protein [Streptomyces sp. NPDC059894]|uniref:NUDIX domain-containing protein n=1 Tax=unclassified Streptomyces TaxID=2593676 RepID=UPI003669F5B1
MISRRRRVLHTRHRATDGLPLTPGGHIEPDDRTLPAAAPREVSEEAGVAPGALMPTAALPPSRSADDTSGAAAARAAMVARLEESGELGPQPVRAALLALPRQILMPQAYVRRSVPDEDPPRWDLLDWSRPADRDELLERLHSGDSVAIQHDGEPIVGRAAGPRRGGSMTAMSSTMGMTADLLQQLDLRPGQRVLDVGTGAGVTASVACFVCGDAGVVSLDIDPNVTAGARERLSALGYQPAVATGDAPGGGPTRLPTTGCSSPSPSAACRGPWWCSWLRAGAP